MTTVNPKLDLVLERTTAVKPETVWKALTLPEHIKKWGVPRPWVVVESVMELHPGGTHKLVMQSPEGGVYPNVGCILEVVERKKLVWTSALLPGYRPTGVAENNPGLLFTAVVMIEPHGTGTKYIAHVLHNDEKARKTHEEMGFQDGWGTCFDQLVEVAKAMR